MVKSFLWQSDVKLSLSSSLQSVPYMVCVSVCVQSVQPTCVATDQMISQELKGILDTD